MHFTKMLNWKAPGPDGLRDFWWKKFTSPRQTMVDHLSECIRIWDVPDWMLENHTVFIQKDVTNGSTVDNYRSIDCLNPLWKLLIGIIADKVYNQLDEQQLLPEEQKGCKWKSRGTKDQPLIDKAILRNSKRRNTNLNEAWFDFCKAYKVPHS